MNKQGRINLSCFFIADEIYPSYREKEIRMNIKLTILALSYLGVIVAANWALTTFGMINIGFGLMAPAGVFFAGLSFGLRDALQESYGRLLTILLIFVGAGLSWFISPTFAIASGAAFLFGELADFAVYTPLREKQWATAVIASNIVGSIVDSILFLWLAFGTAALTWSGILGLTLGKFYMILPALFIVKYYRNQTNDLLRQPV